MRHTVKRALSLLLGMLELDNIVSEEAAGDERTLAGLGLDATAMDVILPTYLMRFREHGQFARTRLT